MHFKTKMSAFTLVGFFFMAGVANAEILEFTATIDGAQAEACAGSGSTGTGTGTFTLDTATGLVNYNISFSGMTGTEIITHIHGPAASCVNTNTTPYQLPLGSPKVGSVTLSAGEQADMINNLHYVNIHTTDNAGGEIRGQIILDVPVPAVSDWGIIAMIIVVLAAGTVLLGRQRRLV